MCLFDPKRLISLEIFELKTEDILKYKKSFPPQGGLKHDNVDIFAPF